MDNLQQIRNRNQNIVLKPALMMLGYDVEPSIKFEDVRDALIKFKELEEHSQVPCDFRIPREDNRYPEHVRGMHLGSAVHGAQINGLYEQHHNELKELGVNFKIIGAFQASFDVIYDAAVAYNQVQSNLSVPYNFIVPCSPAYSKNTWGLELGYALYLIRTDKLYKERKHKLLSLGLSVSVNTPSSFPTVFEALKAYQTVHGDLLVPRNFVVPQGDDRYPDDTWGKNLGKIVQHIRNKGGFPEHRQALIDLGINFEVEKNDCWNFLTQIYPSLKAYKVIHGDLLVPESYEVPQDDKRYHVDTWGMKLGISVKNIRIGGDYIQYKERLTALGLNYDVKPIDIRGFDVIYSALEVYKTIHGNL